MEAWLSRITTNAFLDEVRRKKRRPLEVVPDLPDRVTRDRAGAPRRARHQPPARSHPGRAEGASRSSSAAPWCCATWSVSTIRRSPSRSMSPSEPSAAASTAAGPSSGRCSHDHAAAARVLRRAERLPRRRAHSRRGHRGATTCSSAAPNIAPSSTGSSRPAPGCARCLPSTRPRASSSRRSRPRTAPVAEPKKRKWGMLNLVATAAVWVVVLGFVNMSRSNDVSPDAANLAQTHTEASAGFGGLLGSLGAGRPEQQAAPQVELGEPYWAPLSLPGDLGLRQVQINDNLVGLVYCNDADLVMLYEEPGMLDPNAIAGAQPISVDGHRGMAPRDRHLAGRDRPARRHRLRRGRSARWSARRCGRRGASRAAVTVARGSTRRRRSRTARLVRPRLSPARGHAPGRGSTRSRGPGTRGA